MTARFIEARDASCSETVSLHATTATTRKYGRHELAFVATLREAPARAEQACAPRAEPRGRGRRAGVVASVLLAVALGAAALAAHALHATDRLWAAEGAAAPLRPSAAAAATRPPTAPAPAAPTSPAPASAAAPRPADVIELLASARYSDALAGYERLARAQPSNPAYAAAAAVLRHKLEAQCTERAKAGGLPCPTAAP